MGKREILLGSALLGTVIAGGLATGGGIVSGFSNFLVSPQEKIIENGIVENDESKRNIGVSKLDDIVSDIKSGYLMGKNLFEYEHKKITNGVQETPILSKKEDYLKNIYLDEINSPRLSSLSSDGSEMKPLFFHNPASEKIIGDLLETLLCLPEDKNYIVVGNEFEFLYGHAYNLSENQLIELCMESGSPVTVCKEGELRTYIPREYDENQGKWGKVDIRVRKGESLEWKLDYEGRDIVSENENNFKGIGKKYWRGK